MAKQARPSSPGMLIYNEDKLVELAYVTAVYTAMLCSVLLINVNKFCSCTFYINICDSIMYYMLALIKRRKIYNIVDLEHMATNNSQVLAY